MHCSGCTRRLQTHELDVHKLQPLRQVQTARQFPTLRSRSTHVSLLSTPNPLISPSQTIKLTLPSSGFCKLSQTYSTSNSKKKRGTAYNPPNSNPLQHPQPVKHAETNTYTSQAPESKTTAQKTAAFATLASSARKVTASGKVAREPETSRACRGKTQGNSSACRVVRRRRRRRVYKRTRVFDGRVTCSGTADGNWNVIVVSLVIRPSHLAMLIDSCTQRS
jgi:hypothetical protein